MRLTGCGVLLTLGLLGCGDDDSNEPEPQIEVAGTWSANVPTPPLSGITFEFSLSEVAGVVQGSGAILIFPDDSIPIDIEGTYDEPEVSLTMTWEIGEPFLFVGTVSDTTMEGTLNGGGYASTDVTFERQAE